MTEPLIIGFYDGDAEVQCLSNFAVTPFTLDGVSYHTVEAFWQSLKFEDPIARMKVQMASTGLDAKQAGKFAPTHSQLFTYMDKLYRVGSESHHRLLERALRAKTAQNPTVVSALRGTTAPLKHMIKNRFGSWRSGDSPALPAVTFELMWHRIRDELHNNTFNAELPLPPAITD